MHFLSRRSLSSLVFFSSVLVAVPDSSPIIFTQSLIQRNEDLGVIQFESLITQDHRSIHSQAPNYEPNSDKLESQIRWLLIRLRSHISDVRFMSKSFKKARGTYREELELLELSIEYPPQSTIDIIPNMFNFAKYMFQEMCAATAVLERYSKLFGAERYYVCGVTNLYIWLFHLQDNIGVLNFRVNSYESKIIYSWRKLSMWTEDFKRMTDVPLKHMVAFEKQREKAEEAIDRLWDQIPDSRKVIS